MIDRLLETQNTITDNIQPIIPTMDGSNIASSPQPTLPQAIFNNEERVQAAADRLRERDLQTAVGLELKLTIVSRKLEKGEVVDIKELIAEIDHARKIARKHSRSLRKLVDCLDDSPETPIVVDLPYGDEHPIIVFPELEQEENAA